jgi:hypothetical protein
MVATAVPNHVEQLLGDGNNILTANNISLMFVPMFPLHIALDFHFFMSTLNKNWNLHGRRNIYCWLLLRQWVPALNYNATHKDYHGRKDILLISVLQGPGSAAFLRFLCPCQLSCRAGNIRINHFPCNPPVLDDHKM